jgi:hypothetical protein
MRRVLLLLPSVNVFSSGHQFLINFLGVKLCGKTSFAEGTNEP